MRKLIIIAVGLLILGLVNFSIYSREQTLAHGHVVLLELAPVDPRSLMQGDYMALRFHVANQIRWDRKNGDSADGYIVLSLNDQKVGSYMHANTGQVLGSGQIRMRYRVRNGEVKFATNAFFFQEGDADVYEQARFGEFRVGENGESILVAMRDGNYKLLGSQLGAVAFSGSPE